MSPCFQLWEKFKCIEYIDKSMGENIQSSRILKSRFSNPEKFFPIHYIKTESFKILKSRIFQKTFTHAKVKPRLKLLPETRKSVQNVSQFQITSSLNPA